VPCYTQEAIKNDVFPMDDRRFERLNAEVMGRPDIMAGRKELTLYPGMGNMTENGFIETKSRSITITADLAIPKGGAEGVDPIAGGSVWRMEPLPQRGQAEVCV
jgi:arylsulfatase